MLRHCEVCATESGGQRPTPRLRRLLLDGRIVSLCERHARSARDHGVETLAALRELFREASGRRSAVARRAPLDRRVFPPRPEGRRKSGGRRASDAG